MIEMDQLRRWGRNCVWCMEGEKREKRRSTLVDHGLVFNVIRDGSLKVEEFSRGLLIANFIQNL